MIPGGFRVVLTPSWQEVAAGARPPFGDPDNFEPGTVHGGWQQEASSCVEKHFQVELFGRVPEQVQALIRSQAGPGAGAALSVVPTNLETTIPPHLFRVVLLRSPPASLLIRAQLPMWPSTRRLWPSSRSLRTDGDARSSGLCSGERSDTYLSGSGRTGSHQHVSERHRFAVAGGRRKET